MHRQTQEVDILSRREFAARGIGVALSPITSGWRNADATVDMPRGSLYRSDAGRQIVMGLYERKLEKLALAHQSTMVTTRYGQTHVLTVGPPDAPPLLALHGVHFAGPFMADFVASLADRFRILIPDVVGQPGRSAPLQPSPMGHHYGTWTADVLDALALETVPVIGISFGGAVALDLATVAPQRISRAVLIVPGGFKGSAWTAASLLFHLFLPWHAYRLFPDRARIARVVHPLAWEMDDDWYEYFDAILRYVRWLIPPPGPFSQDDLKGFTAPTAIYAARQDIFFPGDALVKEARQVLPNVAEAMVFDSSHFPTKTLQRELAGRVASFLAPDRPAGLR